MASTSSERSGTWAARGRERFPAGAAIVRLGEPGDKFQLLRGGTVEVSKDYGTQRPLLNTLTELDRPIPQGWCCGQTGVARLAAANYSCLARDQTPPEQAILRTVLTPAVTRVGRCPCAGSPLSAILARKRRIYYSLPGCGR